MRSDSVVLPESMWALMPMLRMRSRFVATWSFSLWFAARLRAGHERTRHVALRVVLGRAPYRARPRKSSRRLPGRPTRRMVRLRGVLMPVRPFRFYGFAAGGRLFA